MRHIQDIKLSLMFLPLTLHYYPGTLRADSRKLSGAWDPSMFQEPGGPGSRGGARLPPQGRSPERGGGP